MDLEGAARKISSELDCDIVLAQQMAKQLSTVHEDLKPVVQAWLDDEPVGYTFREVSLDLIMEKERVKYIQAIFSMNALLNDPHIAQMYANFKFDTDYLSDTNG